MKMLKNFVVLSVFVLIIGALAGVESCKHDIDSPSGDTPNDTSGDTAPDDTTLGDTTPGATTPGVVTPGNSVSKSVTIDVFSFTDFHGVMENSDDPANNPGAARFVKVLKDMISQSEHPMLLSSGDNYHYWDNFSGGATNLSNLFKGAPVSNMMQNIGLKYSVIGNHEWDWGEHFEYFSVEGGITYLAANLYIKGTNTRPSFCKPYIIEEIAGKKIGVVGITVPDMKGKYNTEDFVPPLGDPLYVDYVADYEFKEIGSWLADMVTDLKTNKGCDAVVALTHLNLPDVAKINDKGFDAIILGHTHTSANRATDAIPPTLQPLHYGRGIAKFSFVFGEDGKLSEVKRELVKVMDVLGNDVDKDIAAMIAEYNKQR